MSNKCICFCRVSTQQQDLVQQTNAIISEAIKMGYDPDHQIIIEYKESGISLSVNERAGIDRLKETIENDNSVDCVICWELSRIGRRADVIINIRDFFISHKIQWVVLTPYMRLLDNDGKMNTTSSIILSIFTSIAETEMEIKKERYARGKARSRELGKYTGGTVTFGYSVGKDKRWVINEDEARVIRFIFDCYETGNHSLATISKELQELGYFSDITLLSLMNKVNRWLKQPIYNGHQHCPAIISKEQYDRVQQVLSDHKNVYRLRNVNNMLCKRLLINKKTGRTLVCKAKTGLAKGTNERSIYVSDHRIGRGTSINILQHAIDPVVWECAKMLYEKYLMDDSKVKKRLVQKGEELKRKYEVAKDKIKKIQEKIDRVEERLIYGNISNEKANEITSTLLDEKKRWQNKESKIIDEIRNNVNTIKEYMVNSDIDLDDLTFEQKYDIVHKVIDKVILSKPDPQYRTTIAEIYSKVNDKIYTYKIRTKVVRWELISITNQ